jgi:hypothetical protein
MAQLDLEVARYEALFVSALQRDEPIPVLHDAVREAIHQAIRYFGVRGCAAKVAQEFGDHPDTAVTRMRWARDAVTQAFPAGSGVAQRSGAAVAGWPQAA